MRRNAAYLYLSVSLLLLNFASAQQTATASPVAHTSPIAPTRSAEQLWTDLMAGNQRFVAGHPKTGDLVQLRHEQAKGQHPDVIVLACSDSRVAPELLFDKSLGDLFVVWSAGNIADAIGVGSIEYAAEHLGSTLLVVLGHEKCGAVSAACAEEKMPTVNLKAIVDKISPAVTRAKAHASGDGLLEAAVEENVHQSAKDVIANSPVLKHLEEEGKLTTIEAVYKLNTGEIVRLSEAASAASQ
jgi:carbonic anhydrase